MLPLPKQRPRLGRTDTASAAVRRPASWVRIARSRWESLPRQKTLWLVALLIGIMNTARFIGLDASPLGFVPDEASNATHIICLVETAADANGGRIPLFSDQFEERVQRSGTGLV